jgi:aerobic carbon-monoxide dehydrogenase large subunit
VTRLDTRINRVTGVPMEPRTAVGSYDAASGRYTLYAGSGGIVRQKKELSAILGVPFESVRVVAHEIGGNFGTKNSFFPEFALVTWGSRKVNPVPSAQPPRTSTIRGRSSVTEQTAGSTAGAYSPRSR